MGAYDDIIDLPHYEPKYHQRMAMAARAVQFAPFAAVVGHEAAIREEGRFTDDWSELSDTGNEQLNRKMELLVSLLPKRPAATIDFFLPDARKSGGSYRSVTANVKRIDECERVIELTDGRQIPFDFIRDIRLVDQPSSG